MTHQPSIYQSNIYDNIQHGSGHLVIEAVAGSGKTYTIEQSLRHIPQHKKTIYIAFNKAIVQEIQSRIPSNVQAVTFHSLGLRSITAAFGRPKVATNKTFKILTTVLNEREKHLFSPIIKITGLLKNNFLMPTPENIEDLLYHHNLEFVRNTEHFTDLVQKTFQRGLDQKSIIDFDDMILYPVLYSLPCQQYDYIFVDEAQDLNAAQISMVKQSIKPTGRIIAVGDKKQAIYGFRGADVDSIPNIIKRFKASELPLSVCYRCPTSVIKAAKQFVPQIEAAPRAHEGTITNIYPHELCKYVKPNDLILCRNNAPLIPPCFDLIQKGIKATIKGNDIGKGLIKLVKNLETNNLIDLIQSVREWELKERGKATKKGISPESIVDKADCLYALITKSNIKTQKQLIEHIKKLFSDEKSTITFSSIHKAKGLEANNVFFLKPSLIPSKYATKDWEFTQEENLMYVAITRTKENLYIVE